MPSSKNSKHIPDQESDSEEEQQYKKISPKKKSKKEEDMDLEDSDHDKSEEEQAKSKKNKSKRDGKSDEKIQALIASRIKHCLKEQEDKEFVAPDGIPVEKMEKRYNSFWKRIGTKGIPCRPPKKDMENVIFYLIGVTKEMRLLFFYPNQPQRQFTNPTEVLRAIYNDHGIKVRSIKGWDQCQIYTSIKNSDEPSWTPLKKVIPSDYRTRPKTNEGSNSPKDEKNSSKKRTSTSNEDEKTTRKVQRIVDNSKILEGYLRIPVETVEQLTDSQQRLDLVRAAFCLGIDDIKNFNREVHRIIEKNVQDKQSTTESMKTDENVQVIDQEKKSEPEDDKSSIMEEDGKCSIVETPDKKEEDGEEEEYEKTQSKIVVQEEDDEDEKSNIVESQDIM